MFFKFLANRPTYTNYIGRGVDKPDFALSAIGDTEGKPVATWAFRMSCQKCMNTSQVTSLILYFCSFFCDCRQRLSNWEVLTWQMAPCHNRWDSAVLLKLVSLRFMHSTLRYSPKRKGHPKAFLPLILNHCCDVFTIML